MLKESGHTHTVDWWTIGIMLYELICGKTPFFDRRKIMQERKIKNGKILWPDPQKYNIYCSDELKDVVEKLLDKNGETRLGAKDDFVEVLSHPWFKDQDLDALAAKKVDPPFKPDFGDIKKPNL